MIGHTPGPWSVGFSDGSGPSYITAGERVVVRGCQDDWGITQGVVLEEDARLIAAAPDLLHACQLALEVFDRNSVTDWKVLESAIAKATQP